MGTKLSLCLFLLILLPAFGHAQGFWTVVYGDSSTKKYYSPECGEVAKINQGNRQGFKNAAAAEKAGFVKGDTCSWSAELRSTVRFYGDRSKKAFYPMSCPARDSMAVENWITFVTKDDAEKAGYKIADCPPQPIPPQQNSQQTTPEVKSVPMKRAVLPRIIAITSEPGEWLDKLVTVDADVNITDDWKYSEGTYAFRISDGSASFNLYMEKKVASGLRNLILKQPAAEGVHGRFTFYLNPAGYLYSGELYGRLVSYSVRAD